jgi:hypothetical protein
MHRIARSRPGVADPCQRTRPNSDIGERAWVVGAHLMIQHEQREMSSCLGSTNVAFADSTDASLVQIASTSIDAAIVDITLTSHAGALHRLIRRAAHRAMPLILRFNLTAAVARACSVGHLARHCGLSVRTIEEHLDAKGLMTAKALLTWVLILNAHWRASILGWQLKEIAAEAGIASPDALSKRSLRISGARLPELRDAQSFDALLDTFVNALSRDLDRPNGAAYAWAFDD